MQKIIALHPKTPENRDFLSNGNSSISKKGHRSKIFLSNSKEIEKKRKKTESITFRLESEILDSLRHEARRKDISINTLISQIARQHMDWHSMAAAAGFVSVRKQLLIKLLEGQNDEQIKSVARHVALSSSKDLLLMLRRKYNIVSTLDMIETWVRIAGYSYSHNIEQDYSNRLHSFIIQHHMGSKWSLYLAELYKNLFEEFGLRGYQFDMTDNTLAFEVTVPIEGKGELDHLHKITGTDYRG